MKVWVVMGMEDDGADGYRYVSAVFDSAEKAEAYVAKGWALTAEEFEVK